VPSTSNVVIKTELDDFISVLQHIGETDASIDAASAIVHEMGREVATLAYKYAPKKTGALAKSIEVEYGDRTARVVARAPYAMYVEFGTWSHSLINPQPGTYTIRPKRPWWRAGVQGQGRQHRLHPEGRAPWCEGSAVPRACQRGGDREVHPWYR